MLFCTQGAELRKRNSELYALAKKDEERRKLGIGA